MRFSKPLMGEMRRTTLERVAARSARNFTGRGRVVVFVWVARITSDNLALEDGWNRHLMTFHYDDGEVVLMEEPY